ncbi:hypothetical protein DVH24_035408 [Malus domestica]|uniref:RNase H type-1 domain-containing protein n=1 Tax=Malus domestica TaxID=3750 RepID=A0A498J928_MALDO|nr:hypothetical protein DVH24_035408 [Malus domestica]
MELQLVHAQELRPLLQMEQLGEARVSLSGAQAQLIAKAIALKEGLLFAKCKCVKMLMVKGDSKQVVQMVQDHLKPIIEDIKWLTSKFQHISWKHIYRESNFVMDTLAHLGLSVDNLYFLDYCLPFLAIEAFNFFCIENGCIKGFKL